jgi:hypothetical protein
LTANRRVPGRSSLSLINRGAGMEVGKSGFWDTPGSRPKDAPRSGRRRRRALIALGVTGALLTVVMLAAPTVAGWIAPGYIVSALNSRIQGSASVGRVSLSWFGSQAVGPIVLRDAAGVEVLRVEATCSSGLLGLIGGLDLGDVKLKGSARVIREADGSVNLARLFIGQPGAGSGGTGAGGAEPRIPSGLAARFRLEGAEVTYVDRSAAIPIVLRFGGILARGTFAAGKAASFDFSGDVFSGPDEKRATTPAGSWLASATIDGVTTAAGLVRPDAARFDASIECSKVSSSTLDAVAGMGGRLATALGPTVGLTAKASGTRQDATASIVLASEGAAADLTVRYAEGPGGATLSTVKPATARVRVGGWAECIPALREALESHKAELAVTQWPDATATIGQFRVALPRSNGEPDWRKASLVLTIGTTEAAGRVVLRGETAARGFRIAPMTFAVSAPDLGGPVKVKSDAVIQMEDRPVGALMIDLSAAGLLDNKGHVRRGLPSSVNGTLALSEATTSLARPFIEGMGVDLAVDVGPTVDLKLSAQSRAGDAGQQTELAVILESENIRAAAFASARDSIVTSRDKGFELRVKNVGPLVSRMFSEFGMTIESGGAVVVAAPTFVVDTAKLAAGDMRGAGASLRVTAASASGRIALRAGEPAQSWATAPMSVSIDATELSKGVRVTAGTNATLGGRSAGELDADVTFGGLTDGGGAFHGSAGATLDGSVTLKGAATAIAQPWANVAGLDLPADVGPTVDIGLKASARIAVGGSSPSTDLDVSLTGENVTARAALTLDGAGVRGRDTEGAAGVAVDVRRVGAVIGRFVKGGGARVTPEGSLSIKASGFDVPLALGKPRLDRARGRAELSLGGFAVDVPAGTASPSRPFERIQVGRVGVIASLMPGGAPAIRLDSALTHEGRPFTAKGEVALPGLFTPEGGIGFDPNTFRPTGRVELTDAPSGLARLAPAIPSDLASMLQEAVGRAVTVSIESSNAAVGDQLDLRGSVSGEGAHLKLVAALASNRLDVGRLDGDVAVSPALASLVFVASGFDPPPHLRSTATATFSVSPLRLPLGAGFVPDWGRASDLSTRFKIEGPAIVEGLTVPGEGGARRELGPTGIEGLEVLAGLPLTALDRGGRGIASVTLKGRLVGGGREPIGEVDVASKVRIAGGVPAGEVEGAIKLTRVGTKRLDELIGKPGAVSGALGEWASVDGSMTGRLMDGGAGLQTLTVRGDVLSPRMNTTKPVKATMTPALLALDGPLTATWKPEPAWATAWLLGQPSADAGSGPRRRKPVACFTAAPEVTLSVFRLSLPLGDAPMKPGVFGFDVSAEAPALVLEAGDGSPARFEAFKLRAQGGGQGQEPGSVGFSVRMDSPGGAAGSAVQFAGGVYQLADPQGRLTTDRAVVTLRGGASNFPTPLIDALAHQGGLLIDALGPAVTLDVDATGLSAQGGNVTASAESERAKLSLKGVVRDGTFLSAGPVQGEILEVTPTFGARLVEGLPMVGTFEKRRQDGPAKVTATQLRVPVDGDMRKLNGEVTLELGQVRFATSNIFATVLKAAGQKDMGTLGRRVEPLKLTMRDGVISYDRYRLPLGEFIVQTRGEVNLVDRTLDVVTYIPLGALTDEAAGVFNTGLGKLLGGAIPMVERASMVPWRTRGPIDNPSTSPDVGLFVKEFGQSLLRPDRMLRDLLGGKGGG